jgi:nitroreductase
MSTPRFVPYRPERLPVEEMRRRAAEFLALMNRRRSVRQFAPDPVPRDLVETAIRTASTAPSGAHRQPWTFAVVEGAETRRRIREAAEEEERVNYEGGRFPPDWLEALAPLGTTWEKPHLTDAPVLVVVFEHLHGHHPDGRKRKNYYVKESVGIACGLFIAALHNMGLATLPHTPSPMRFLGEILGRPANEKAYVVFPVGYPAADAQVPDLKRKGLAEVAVWDAGRGPATGSPE